MSDSWQSASRIWFVLGCCDSTRARARQPARLSEAERGATVAGGSEVAGERLRRAAFGPKIPPGGEAKLPPISGQKSSLRTVT